MALFFYSFYVGQAGTTPAQVTANVRQSELGALESALQFAGGRLTKVVITGWIEIAGTADLQRVEESLGWRQGQRQPMETRELQVVPRQGRLFLTLTWTMNGGALHNWEERSRLVQLAMRHHEKAPYITVQLEGERKSADPDWLTEVVSSALQGSSQQRWRDERAASVAGHSPLLPPSALSVNYQTAARRMSDGMVKVWVGWPALNQEY